MCAVAENAAVFMHEFRSGNTGKKEEKEMKRKTLLAHPSCSFYGSKHDMSATATVAFAETEETAVMETTDDAEETDR